jgi:transposase
MRETITMTSSDQRRTTAMTRLVAGELTVAEVAVLLGRSERSIWRLRRRYVELGVDAIVHGNRGRASPRRLAEATRTRILDLAATVYDGANDSHLAELLAERDGIVIGRSSLQRLLRSAGRASPKNAPAMMRSSNNQRNSRSTVAVSMAGIVPVRSTAQPVGCRCSVNLSVPTAQ